MRTRRSGPRARALRSGAALLTAGVLAAGLLTPSAQVSSAAAARLPVAASPADPGREHSEIARKVMADPLGRAGMEAHESLHVEDGGRNLAIIWFDVTDFPRHVYRRITKQFDNLDFSIGFPGSRRKADRRRYEGRGRVLRHAGKEALFERLGMSPDRTVLELTAVNVPVSRAEGAYDAAGVHSEALIYEKILRPFLRELGLSAGEVDTLLGKAVGGFSDRARCPACHRITIRIPADKFASIVSYDPKEKPERTNRVGAIIASGTKIVREYKGEQEAKAKQAMPVSGGSATDCVSKKAGSGPLPVMAMTLPLAAAGDCGEGGSRVSSGALGRALETPAGADAYGGVDFSTLEMRYISDGLDGLSYAYSGTTLPDEYQQDPGLGARVVQDFGTDLRTWLALDPQKFWVNLNPAEPDRIVDAALGRTNAGRVMLEADLQMKRTKAKILHPDAETGKRFWRDIRPSANGSLCLSSRMWIVPGKIEVHENGEALHILEAPLDVKTESLNVDDPDAGSCDTDPVADAHNENLERTLVLPEIRKAVNTAPEYAPLRRAFLARIIAQWVRKRHQQGHRTSFDGVIDSEEPGESTHGGRSPKDVFDDYVHSYRHKEFDVTRRTTEGRVTRVTRYVYGGADFTRVDLTTVGKVDMRERYPQFVESAQASVERQVTAADGSVWLGGSTIPAEEGFWSSLKDDAVRMTGGNGFVLSMTALVLGGLLLKLRSRLRRRGRPSA
ncbi:hypothetical protein [Streptomyces sp. NRRL F-5135]|uniref:hypothetical protein n=1 Tax=Streptomyces sp. NRRL F-5135 TaxID=1463858 RepID=UPI0004CBF351|nr:hypothetical protein [Streptomyces sp. NRRL F-5135]